MWWSDPRSTVSIAADRIARLAAALGVAACAGGCFQPLYADRTLDGSPGSGLRGALGAVDVKQIDTGKGTDEARLAVEILQRPDLRSHRRWPGTKAGLRPGHPHELHGSPTSSSIPPPRGQRSRTTASTPPMCSPRPHPESRWSMARPSRASPMTFRARSSASPGCAACATPRPAPPR